MKRILPLALFALAACTTVQSNQSLLSANALYTAASNGGEALVRAGQMDKERFKEMDRQAYAALLAVRAGTATMDDLREALKPLKGEE